MKENEPIVAVVPAAGVGARMQADRPKQYLQIAGKTVLQHSVERLLENDRVQAAVVAVSDDDPYFDDIQWQSDKPVYRVSGGCERADSVLSGATYALTFLNAHWVLVHDAARPCLRSADLNLLIEKIVNNTAHVGGILAVPVRDTMKRTTGERVEHTVDREQLWHAQTPQLFPATALTKVLSEGLADGAIITDEASAFEWANQSHIVVEGHADNIKITHPEDLVLAKFYLDQKTQQEFI
ncbi:2-C-methyl-D-erythritol 4-phosphate cytidylyltransferase [Echinimonas agarilytica]|uniref:2-C-methyl-D-erythritol 4-phosphate cytidylyltransferase n=1 Tax=Echinimonas agarilytica TaxID=1215918 RepID=A0AA42B6N2_9GAMM|nr:2-C-methyl-D-erythritol 4-phosphate cytidylyltransferase [Echinimonas agarilytica]MCM2678835.1 2-C-methyl-D-erythritol 4-phosphate cytidylyltransferase [Echinimonas agarilytica]